MIERDLKGEKMGFKPAITVVGEPAPCLRTTRDVAFMNDLEWLSPLWKLMATPTETFGCPK
jgi:hypothetical protein